MCILNVQIDQSGVFTSGRTKSGLTGTQQTFLSGPNRQAIILTDLSSWTSQGWHKWLCRPCMWHFPNTHKQSLVCMCHAGQAACELATETSWTLLLVPPVLAIGISLHLSGLTSGQCSRVKLPMTSMQFQHNTTRPKLFKCQSMTILTGI